MKTQPAIVLIFLSALLINGIFSIKDLVGFLTHPLDEALYCGKNSRGIADYLPVAQAENRFAKLKEYLAGQNRVSYVYTSENVTSDSKEIFVDIDSMGKLIMAQYALTPLIVEHESAPSKFRKPPYVIIESEKEIGKNYLAENNLDLVKDIDKNMVLAKRHLAQ